MSKTRRKIIFSLVFIGLFLCVSQIFSYNNTLTHPKLTQAVVKFYNQQSSKKLTQQQINWIIQGSIKEDEPVMRCVNHFYDPIHHSGLSDGKYKYAPTMAAPQWANSSVAQSIAGYGGDYSWQTAIYNYQQGNYEKAFVSLGHVLHLLEDMAVPAHTRNDAHEEGDPYEKWAEDNDNKIKINITQAVWHQCDSSRQCLKQLAQYTNSNFFSKDTTSKLNYLYPFGKMKIESDGYARIDNRIVAFYDRESGKLIIDKPKVHQSYWDHLAPMAVGYGAGLIELFFKEVAGKKVDKPQTVLGDIKQKVKNTGVKIKNKLVSSWQGIVKSYKNLSLNIPSRLTKVINNRGEISLKEVSPFLTVDQGKVLSMQEKQMPKVLSSEILKSGSLLKNSSLNDSSQLTENITLNIALTDNTVVRVNRANIKAEVITNNNKPLPVNQQLNKQKRYPLMSKEEQSSNNIGVAYVIDGDTIILTTGEKVRYIGIDAPELNKPGPEDDQCLAWAARLRNMQLLAKGELRLVKDPAVDKDQYGRLLRYVYAGDLFVNEQLAREGLVKAFFCQPGWQNCPVTADKQRRQIITAAVSSAKQNKRGLFSGACQQQPDKKAVKKKVKIEKKSNLVEIAPDKASQAKASPLAQNFIFVASDSLAPVTTISKKPTNPTNLSSAEFEFSANEQAVFSCKIDQAAWQDCASPVNYADLDSGQHIFSVKAVDLAGNVEAKPVEYKWEIDLTIPSTPVVLWPAEFPYYASSTPIVISGTNDSNLAVLIRSKISVMEVLSLTADSWQSSLDLVEGENVFYLKSRNQFNEYSGEDDFTVILDTIAPTIAINSGPGSFASSTTANFQFNSDEANVIYQCQFNNGGWQACAASTTISNLAQGEHSLRVQGIDQAGNTSSVTVYNWLVDTTAPTSTIVNLAEQYNEVGFTVSWTGNDATSTMSSGIESYDAQYRIGSGGWQDWLGTVMSTSTIFNLAVEAGQSIYFRSRARDQAGNVGEWSNQTQTQIASNTVDHIVISEVQFAGATTIDEFVELYNPTDNAINLGGYRLSRKTSSGNKYNLLTSFAEVEMPAHSYYLITHPSGYEGRVAADAVYSTSQSIAANNTIILYSDAGQNVIDKVGAGTASDFERAVYPNNPAANQGLERKANANASSTSMISGIDQWQGNGYDSDDNSQDFVVRNTPDPQNSSSPTEPRNSAPIIPEAITDLIAQTASTNSSSVQLYWTSPDNANLGNGAYYDLRYKEKSGDCNLHLTWHNANQVATSSLPIPADLAGQDQAAVISGLGADTEYCFAVRVFNGENWSNLSNQVSEATLSAATTIITVDSTSSSTPYSNQQTITWSHTVSGNDTVLLVQVFWQPTDTANRSISSVTYNNAPLSLAVSGGNQHSGIYSAIYYLVNPSSGEHNIIVSFPVQGVFSAASAISLNNCDTTNPDTINPIDSTYFRYAGSAHVENTITATSTNIILVDAVSAKQSSFALTPDVGQIEFFDQIIANYPNVGYVLSGSASYKLVNNSGDHQMGWTMPNYSVWSHSIVAIKAKP